MLAFNLLPEIKQQQRDFQKKLERTLVNGKVVLGLTAILSLFMLFVFLYLAKESSNLAFKIKIQMTDRKNIEIERIQREAEAFNEELKNFDDQLPKRKWSSLLIILASLKQKGITFTEITHTQGNNAAIDEKTQKSETIDMLAIKGKALTREDLISFKDSLEASPLFRDVVLPLSNFENPKDISFKLTLQIN